MAESRTAAAVRVTLFKRRICWQASSLYSTLQMCNFAKVMPYILRNSDAPKRPGEKSKRRFGGRLEDMNARFYARLESTP